MKYLALAVLMFLSYQASLQAQIRTGGTGMPDKGSFMRGSEVLKNLEDAVYYADAHCSPFKSRIPEKDLIQAYHRLVFLRAELNTKHDCYETREYLTCFGKNIKKSLVMFSDEPGGKKAFAGKYKFELGEEKRILKFYEELTELK